MNDKPRVLLIGAGRFGKNYLRILSELHAKGGIDLIGIIVRTKEEVQELKKEFSFDILTSYSNELLKKVDCVFIVTPPETHFKIVQECLPYTDVFVEKPLAMSVDEITVLESLALKHKHILTVGHIFRFHPVTTKLKEILPKELPKELKGAFINPLIKDQQRPILSEMLHLFDVVDYLWSKEASSVFITNKERLASVSVRYENLCDLNCDLGWFDKTNERFLSIDCGDKIIKADYIKNEVTITSSMGTETIVCSTTIDPLSLEIKAFLNRSEDMVFPDVAKRISKITDTVVLSKKNQPTVAIIGGGIFGTSAALALSEFCNVTLYEKNSDILLEGTKVNQFRHHYGYHYPRSDETVHDVQRSMGDFELIYEEAIVRDTPTYYGIAKEGSHVSEEEFLQFCTKHNLPFEVIEQSSFDKERVGLVIKVPEPSYHYDRLAKITKRNLSLARNMQIKCGHLITGITIEKDGKKKLTIDNGKGDLEQSSHDYVINATYASINKFTKMGGFKIVPIRVDLTEVLIITLPINPISLTVMDGPFATVMPTGNLNEFTLYHAKESILARYTPEDGQIIDSSSIASNQAAILKKSMELFPVLKDAVVIESRILHRGVQANREFDDSRVADIIPHGFGCWSVLSGKIVSSASAAKKIAEIILDSQS